MSRSSHSPAVPVAAVLLSFVALTACASDSIPAETTTEQTVVEFAASPDETDEAQSLAEGDVESVFTDPAFEVRVTKDVVYAQGLSHESPNSDAAVEMDLLLDVYEPVRSDDVTMPAVVMIHGGGFTGGSKQTGWIKDMAPWFASRGWVVYSVDYRVAGDLGTTLPKLALAWCLKNPDVSTVLLGASKPEQLEENLGAPAVVPLLTEDVMVRIEEILDNAPAHPQY